MIQTYSVNANGAHENGQDTAALPECPPFSQALTAAAVGEVNCT
jgi:hypothetical protein